MSSGSQPFRSLLLAGALASSLAGIACEHHYYRVYDPYYTDYHVWNDDGAWGNGAGVRGPLPSLSAINQPSAVRPCSAWTAAMLSQPAL